MANQTEQPVCPGDAFSDEHSPPQGRGSGALAKRTLLIAAVASFVVGLLVLGWYTFSVWLTVFGGVLFALFLHGAAVWVRDTLGWPHRGALTAVILAILAIAGLGVWLAAPAVAQQWTQLADELPQALEDARGQIRGVLPPAEQLLSGAGNWYSRFAGYLSTTVGALATLAAMLVIGLYLAGSPEPYRKGLLQLVPPTQRAQGGALLDELERTLWWWLVARIAAMLAVGALITAGLWAMGIPLALLLGIVAGLFDFVPNIGPIIAATPAILIALTISPQQALLVALLYIAVQATEGFVITPLAQQKAVELPPAVVLVAQLVFGLLGGILGLIFATPLAAVLVVTVRKLYVERGMQQGSGSSTATADQTT